MRGDRRMQRKTVSGMLIALFLVHILVSQSGIRLTATPRTMVPLQNRIVFHSDRDGNFEIYSMNDDGTDQTRLTSNPGNDWYAVWSPDGKKIAFTSEQDGNQEIYAMDADGTNQIRLTHNSASDWVPDWSLDGSKIAFASNRDGNSEIYVMNADGTSQTRLTANAADDRDPVFSPEGTKIAFESNIDGNSEIYTMNVDGTGATRLTQSSAVDRHPDWLSNKIAFTSNRDGNDEIYIMNSDGSSQTRLTFSEASDLDPTLSSDNRIFFSSNRDGNYEIYAMDMDGRNPARLTKNAAQDYRPDCILRQSLGSIPVCGKGIWLTRIWLTEDGGLSRIIERLDNAKVNWVAVKCGDGDYYWLNDAEFSNWANSFGGFSQVIKIFHDNGIKVIGAHYIYGYNKWEIPGSSELDVSNKILDIEGIDGLLIDAESEAESRLASCESYLKSLRNEHGSSFIAYTSYANVIHPRDELHELFTQYCDVSMPQTYWTVRGIPDPTTHVTPGISPEEEIDNMESNLGKLRDKWNNKPIMPMGVSGICVMGDGIHSREVNVGEIRQFCDYLFNKGYDGASLFAYEIMSENWKWNEYSACFNPELTFAGYCPVNLVITDSDGLTINRASSEISGAIYMEYDINGDGSCDDEILILHRKIGDYFIAVVTQPNALPNDTYTLRASTGNTTAVLAENASISDIPSHPYIISSNETTIIPRFDLYDIGITRFITSKTVVGQNFSLPFNVTIFNYGNFTEALNVSLYANTTQIATFIDLGLASRNSSIIASAWNTTGFAKGNYTISAYVWPVPGETDTADNTRTGGWVVVTIPGDVNADGTVNILDISIAARSYGTKPGDTKWNPNADINEDGTINILDISAIAKEYGKKD
jgi:Tol biopolymer transport system component